MNLLIAGTKALDIHGDEKIVGQFGTGQFSTGQFGTKIIKQTIWHQDNKSGQFGTKIIKVDNLAPGQFGTRTIWHRRIWHQDNMAPNI